MNKVINDLQEQLKLLDKFDISNDIEVQIKHFSEQVGFWNLYMRTIKYNKYGKESTYEHREQNKKK